MPYRKIDTGVKIAAYRLYDQGQLRLSTILRCCEISESTFYRMKKLYEETGNIEKPRCLTRGRPRTLHKSDIQYLIKLIQHKPDYFLDELEELLATNRLVSIHYTTVCRELLRAGISIKKIKRIAKERDENVRADFVRRIAEYSPEQLAFMDEVSKDERTVHRRNGRSQKGECAAMKGVFVRGRRLSAEGVLTINGMVASKVIEGSFTKELFFNFLEHEVACSFHLFLLVHV